MPRRAITRAEQPWNRPGATGEGCDLLFDAETRQLWVRVGETFHPVQNLVVEELTVEYHRDLGLIPEIGGSHLHYTKALTTEVTLRAMLIERE